MWVSDWFPSICLALFSLSDAVCETFTVSWDISMDTHMNNTCPLLSHCWFFVWNVNYIEPAFCFRHYPKTSFTIVADTPENLRLRQQSELQSQVHTHSCLMCQQPIISDLHWSRHCVFLSLSLFVVEFSSETQHSEQAWLVETLKMKKKKCS